MIRVDRLRAYPNKPFRHRRWAHLWSDGGVAELHAFAARVGLKRCWFQDRPGFPHYDVTLSKHSKALALGAQLTDLGAWLLASRRPDNVVQAWLGIAMAHGLEVHKNPITGFSLEGPEIAIIETS